MNRWKISSAGRAPALQAGGHRFEPCIFHHHGAVVQLVRMPACHAGGRGFEPLPRRHFALVAQSVEQETENLRVGGSIPPLGTRPFFCGSSSAGRVPPCQGGCRGSESRLPLHFYGAIAKW